MEPASHLTSQTRSGTGPLPNRDRKDDAAHASLSQINLSKSARTRPEAAPGSGANPGETVSGQRRNPGCPPRNPLACLEEPCYRPALRRGPSQRWRAFRARRIPCQPRFSWPPQRPDRRSRHLQPTRQRTTRLAPDRLPELSEEASAPGPLSRPAPMSAVYASPAAPSTPDTTNTRKINDSAVIGVRASCGAHTFLHEDGSRIGGSEVVVIRPGPAHAGRGHQWAHCLIHESREGVPVANRNTSLSIPPYAGPLS